MSFSSAPWLCAVIIFAQMTLDARAGVSASSDYTVVCDTFDGGGSQGASADYKITDSTGLIVDVASGGPLQVILLKAGYVAQLADGVAVEISAASTIVDEGLTLQLAAAQVLDDGSQNLLQPAAVAWGVISGPVSSVSTAGVALAAPVFQDDVAVVSGTHGGLSGTLGLTVRNIDKDNFGSYAGDGIDDAWQMQYFGPDNPAAAPLADPDHDGQNNRFEYVAGVVPTSPVSWFRLMIENVPGFDLRKRLVFHPRLAGRTYTVETSTSLDAGALWEPLADSMTQDDAESRAVTDLNATGVRRFYRVEITMP